MVDAMVRDLYGYGRRRPLVAWPGAARVAVSFVLNYEEGGERNVLDGDAHAENYLVPEVVGLPPIAGRSRIVEDLFEYGSRAGLDAGAPKHQRLTLSGGMTASRPVGHFPPTTKFQGAYKRQKREETMIGCIGRSGPTGEQRRRGLLTTGLSRSPADLQNEQERGRRLFPLHYL